jgi:hypothetical protein
MMNQGFIRDNPPHWVDMANQVPGASTKLVYALTIPALSPTTAFLESTLHILPRISPLYQRMTINLQALRRLMACRSHAT